MTSDTTTTSSSRATRRVTMAELPGLVGTSLGSSSRVVITQEQINLFADATNDHQWIHVDPARAARGPFGAPIAHGYLTLSLAVDLYSQLIDVTDCDQLINYGLDKVRFPAPVPVDSSVGAVAEVTSVEPCAGGYQIAVTLTFDALGVDRPVCVAQMILRYLGSAGQATGGDNA